MHIADLAELALSSDDSAALGVPAGSLRLRRAWPRSPDHLLVEYIAGNGAIVPGQWRREDEALDRASVETRNGALQPERVRAVSCAGDFRRLLLQPGGEDAELRGLAPLLAQPGAALIVHRPERRAVVRLTAGDGGVSYAKFQPPRRIEIILQREEFLRAATAGARFSLPAPFEVKIDEGAIRYAAARGESLHDLWPRADAAVMRAVGAALHDLHAIRVDPAALPVHGAAEEVEVLSKWMGHLRAFHPQCGDALAEEFERLQALLLNLEAPASPSILHRDFYDKQIFVDGGHISFIDVDTAATGDAALDVGNIIAHLEHRDATRAAVLARAFLEGYGEVDDRRLDAYLASSRLRLRCVHAFRPPF